MKTYPGKWSDVVWSSRDGFVVVTSGPGGTTAYRVRDDAVLWHDPVQLVGVRAAAADGGSVGALGGRSTDNVVVACWPTPVELDWTVASPLGCVLTIEDGQPIAYIQINGTEFVRQPIGGPKAKPEAIPGGETSQGMLDVDPTRGGIVWTDPNHIIERDGLGLVNAMQRVGCWVGQAVKTDATVGTIVGQHFQVVPKASGGSLPHVAADGGGTEFCVATPLEGGTIAVVLSPFEPLVETPPAPEPQPAPDPAPAPTPVPPQGDPMLISLLPKSSWPICEIDGDRYIVRSPVPVDTETPVVQQATAVMQQLATPSDFARGAVDAFESLMSIKPDLPARWRLAQMEAARKAANHPAGYAEGAIDAFRFLVNDGLDVAVTISRQGQAL